MQTERQPAQFAAAPGYGALFDSRETLESGVGAGGGVGGVFSCIVADPPWAIKFGSDTRRHERTGGGDKGTWKSEANMAYPTMSVAEICALKVPAAKDAHCYIWTINAYVEETYRVARAWGFRPVVLLTWGKTPRGLGFGGAFVQTTEHILFCRRGRDICKKRVDSTWWNWPRPEKGPDGNGPKHSRKPEQFQRMVESVSPGPYLEMFARRGRPNWTAWGNEVSSGGAGGGGVGSVLNLTPAEKRHNDPKLSERSPESARVPEPDLGAGAACALADAVTEPVKPEPGAETERQGCDSLQRLVRRCPDKL